MTAEELLVERFLELERKVKELEEDIETKQDDVDTAMEELADHDNLVQILSKYIKVTKYGVSFELRNYYEEEKADIDYLANYFDVEFKEETQGEG
jgi:uncharacterized protein YoxC